VTAPAYPINNCEFAPRVKLASKTSPTQSADAEQVGLGLVSLPLHFIFRGLQNMLT
jgi:hypothetical protein